MMLRVSVLLSLSALSACATYSPQAPVSTSTPAVVTESAPVATSAPVITSPEPIRVEPAPRPTTPAPETIPQRRTEPATPASTLLASVDEAMAAGDLERAAALSERALRISPRDAYLWYRLANIRYVQRQYSEAEGFARRALSFAGNDRALTQQINQLLTQLAAAN
ncbi:MAG: tetratricopeptide repeat protein [Pseudohongiella sp.]|nr:tetratricopeptide repeat protein [Pseudohongiella sp.]